MQAHMNGSRLAYVVVPIEGNVIRKVNTYKKDKGLIEKFVEQPGGYMVYFPRGHVLRLRDKAELRRYKLDKPPRIINIEGLADPNSPIGRVLLAQDEAGRQGAMADLEKQVMQLAQAKSGKIEVTKDPRDLPQHEDLSHLE